MFRIAQKRALARLCAVAVCALTSTLAHAVVVRGVVRDPLGRPISVAHVRLVKGKDVVASTVTQPDGSFEIRSTEDGRFLLLADAPMFSEQISDSFYGGQLDVVQKDLHLTVSPIKQDITVTATGVPTPVQQTSASVSLIDQQSLSTRVGVLEELRLQPGVAVVQTGQYGGLTSLFVRGADSSANKVLFDDVPANDVGGTFDFGTVSSTALTTVETHRGPDSILYGTDARAGVVRFETPRGTTLKPVLNYSGDAGNLHTWR
ncbi:MAG: TonB-dependent receptor plug domain-containing protein, partial [Terriglobus sp.]